MVAVEENRRGARRIVHRRSLFLHQHPSAATKRRRTTAGAQREMDKA
jgi:hypothetical protein